MYRGPRFSLWGKLPPSIFILISFGDVGCGCWIFFYQLLTLFSNTLIDHDIIFWKYTFTHREHHSVSQQMIQYLSGFSPLFHLLPFLCLSLISFVSPFSFYFHYMSETDKDEGNIKQEMELLVPSIAGKSHPVNSWPPSSCVINRLTLLLIKTLFF